MTPKTDRHPLGDSRLIAAIVIGFAVAWFGVCAVVIVAAILKVLT